MKTRFSYREKRLCKIVPWTERLKGVLKLHFNGQYFPCVAQKSSFFILVSDDEKARVSKNRRKNYTHPAMMKYAKLVRKKRMKREKFSIFPSRAETDARKNVFFFKHNRERKTFFFLSLLSHSCKPFFRCPVIFHLIKERRRRRKRDKYSA